MSANILFLTLKVFSSTGGIEKVCRIAGKAFYEFGIRRNASLSIYSMYDGRDAAIGNRYFPSEMFEGFAIRKSRFMLRSVKKGCKSDIVILSHINLLLAGWLIKKLNPKVKILLFAHGIEIWGRQSKLKRHLLNCCDEIIAVSEYTRERLISENAISRGKCSVINNCLDPFLIPHKNVQIPADLPSRYGIAKSDKIIFTLSRLSARERYKGYDKVMEAIVSLPDQVKYLIAGSYDKEEKLYIEHLVEKLQLGNRVVLAGFIDDEEVPAHFAMSHCYAMPSIKEGFGIVFIESMFYHLPVIAGNKDGSIDALRHGEFGILVNPSDVSEIRSSIKKILEEPVYYLPSNKLLCHYFGYESYKLKVNSLLLKHLGITDKVLANYLATEYFNAV